MYSRRKRDHDAQDTALNLRVRETGTYLQLQRMRLLLQVIRTGSKYQ